MPQLESLLFNADVIKGAAQQLPLLLVMWYMMKELQKKTDHLTETVTALQKQIHEEKVARLEAELADAKDRAADNQ